MTKREWLGGPVALDVKVSFVVTVPCSLAFALLGPFGGYDTVPLPERIGFWLAIMTLGLMILIMLLARGTPWRRFVGIDTLGRFAMTCAVCAVPLTPISEWLLGTVDLARGNVFYWFQSYGQVLLVVAAGCAITRWVSWRPAETTFDVSLCDDPISAQVPVPAAHTVAVDDDPLLRACALRSRLSPHLHNAALCALSMEDHYVRVHTDAGTELLLLRLADAISETAGIEGRQVHRSWWVARHALMEAVSLDGSYALDVRGGVVAPVARRRVSLLRADGWLEKGK